jgi:hypothetical protein
MYLVLHLLKGTYHTISGPLKLFMIFQPLALYINMKFTGKTVFFFSVQIMGTGKL